MQKAPILYYDRDRKIVEQEQIYGEKWLRWAYETVAGRACLSLVIKRAFFSRLYGSRMSRPQSRARIAPFVKKYGIDLGEAEKSLDEFISFNDFFYRTLKPSARPVDGDPKCAVFGAEGRHRAVSVIGKETGFYVKGQAFDLAKLLGDAALAERYKGGTLVFSRLCPVDYHRFHFPCAGVPSASVLIEGPLYSVSPVALRRRLSYLWENRRMRTALETAHFGTVQILEIGATNVGSIVQTFAPGVAVEKAAPKGYFAFGGSAVITVFAPGALQLADDLTGQNALGYELFAKMGTPMGLA